MTGFQTQILEVALIIIFFFVAFKGIKEGIETFIEHLNAKSKNEEDDGNAKIGDDGLSNSHLLYCSNCGKSYNPTEHIRFCAECGHKL